MSEIVVDVPNEILMPVRREFLRAFSAHARGGAVREHFSGGFDRPLVL